MTRPLRVLITAPRLIIDLERMMARLAATGWDLRIERPSQCFGEDALIPMVGDIDGAICGGDRWSARVFDAAPRLRALCKWGTGVDAIDLDAARRRGIAVRNVPNAFTVPVSDTVICLILNFCRRCHFVATEMSRGGWGRQEGAAAAEMTLGVVGVGNIGSAVLRKARALGMTLLCTDPRPPGQELLDDTGAALVDLDTLLRESDFVSLHCDLNPTSRRLIGARQLRLMKPSSVLINTARGGVVDQQALVEALREGRIAGAALDVFEDEPLPDEHPLRRMGNVMLSPHMANTSDRACFAVHERVIRNMEELLRDTPARTGAGAPASREAAGAGR
jgi:D-3-phosphoglycerate dehydrogenase